MTHIYNGERRLLEKDLEDLRRQKVSACYHLAHSNLNPELRKVMTDRVPYLDSAIERLSARLASSKIRHVPLNDGFSVNPQLSDSSHNREREYMLR